MKRGNHETSIEVSLAKFVGRTEAQAEAFALSIGVFPQAFTEWLGRVLLGHGEEIRKPLGTPDSLSSMRGYSTERPKRVRSPVEVDELPSSNGTRQVEAPEHSRRRMSPETIENIRASAKRRWANMKPTKKKALLKRMLAARNKGK